MTTGTEAKGLQPKRGEVWLARLGSAKAGEPGKNRPVLIISADGFAPYGPTDLVPVVPLSSSRTPTPSNVKLSADFLEGDSVAVCRAIRGLSRSRLLERFGAIEATQLKRVDQALRHTLSL
jgi:mRNA interferase MazF